MEAPVRTRGNGGSRNGLRILERKNAAQRSRDRTGRTAVRAPYPSAFPAIRTAFRRQFFVASRAIVGLLGGGGILIDTAEDHGCF
jgi:hypothetical protein